jgi:phosphate:Na+ symporter
LKLAVFHSVFNTLGIVVMLPFINRLVNLLMRIMPEKKVSLAEPRYLNESAIELPDTAIEVVRQETLHLYDNAFAIISHGLSLHRHDILSDQDMDEVVLKSHSVMPIDFDAEYDTTIKALYSEIVNFISRAQHSMEPDQANELFAMRAAGRDIVEAIKDTKHMHKNMSHFIASDNEYIRAEYNKIRSFIGSVLHRLSIIQKSTDDDTGIFLLDVMRLEMEENDSLVNVSIENLVREEKITPLMATSLMNDASYAYDVTKNLLQMGETLFATGEQSMKDAERTLLLNDDDISEVMGADETNR